MNKLWLWVALVAVGIGVALYFGGSKFESGTANRAWPAGLGVSADAAKRFPKRSESASAKHLIELASVLDIDLRPEQRRMRSEQRSFEFREELIKYLRAQLERSGDTIDATPPLLAQFLKTRATTLDEARALLNGPERVVWALDPSLKDGTEPNESGCQLLARVFIARALDEARQGDPKSWDDLRAAWRITESLWPRPEVETASLALSAARMVTGAARKMPLPPPVWVGEILSFDATRAMAAVYQGEAWKTRSPALNERFRQMAAGVITSRACDGDGPSFESAKKQFNIRATPNLKDAWWRAMRFTAEREATQRILQLRAGHTPSPASQCSDGTWVVTPKSIRFTREIKTEPPQIGYPLNYSR